MNNNSFGSAVHILSPEEFFISKKEIIKFNKSDSIILSPEDSKDLFEQNNFVLKIKYENNYTYGKVTRYDAPARYIVIPKWMMEKIKVNNNDIVFIELSNLDIIKKIKLRVPKEMYDPQSILEYELINRHILTESDIIKINIFDKSYDIIIDEIETSIIGENKLKRIKTGMLYDNGIESNINFDMIQY